MDVKIMAGISRSKHVKLGKRVNSYVAASKILISIIFRQLCLACVISLSLGVSLLSSAYLVSYCCLLDHLYLSILFSTGVYLIEITLV